MATADLKSKRPAPARPVTAPREDRDDCFVIPADATTLAGFRAWSYSGDFPQRGRITFLGGEIIVDMSPERLTSHVGVKTEITRVLANLVVENDLGKFFADGTRIANVPADVSNEPDAVFVSWASFEHGKVREVPTTDGKDYIELEGTPDWVVEILSPSSVMKDTVKLLDRYHRAGIPEYWLIDARKDVPSFQILLREPTGYTSTPRKSGWQKSGVFGKQFRLRRTKNRIGGDSFSLDQK